MSSNKISNTARQPSSRQKRATPSANTAKTGTGRTEYNKPNSPSPAKSGYSSAHSPKASRAKKLVVRTPNQEIVQRSRNLKEKREDLDKIEPMRVQKVLAASGAGSRREMEQWVNQGMVQINGKVATLGDKVGPQDRVTVKGNSIKLKWPDRLPRILIYYKQEGEIVSRDDPQGRVTIFDRLPQAKSSRWVAIGRLDVNTSGLLILTTSGELVNRFAHPSFEVEREYAVRILGELTTEQKKELTTEVMLDDGVAKLQSITDQGGEGVNKWYNVVIKEGRNREVRRIFETMGLTVSRLMRIRFGPIGLPQRLKRGSFYELNQYEVANIVKWADMLLPGEKRR